MRSTGVIRMVGAIAFVALAACGGDDADDATSAPTATAATNDNDESAGDPAAATTDAVATTPAPVAAPAETITSDDGSLTIDVPAGANDTGVSITAERVEPGLSDALDPLTSSWELGPDGAQFASPSTVAVTTEDRWDGAAPLVLVALQSGDDVELVPDVSAEVVGGQATFTFEIDHFTRVYLFEGNLQVSLDPGRYGGPPDSEFTARLLIRGVDDTVSTGFLDLSAAWGADGEAVRLAVDSDPEADLIHDVQGYACRAGTGRYWVDFAVTDAFRNPDNDGQLLPLEFAKVLGLDVEELPGITHRALLFGDADCTDPGIGCQLEPSDPGRPSIGEAGDAAVEALPDVTADADPRDVGVVIMSAVDEEVLCLEDVIAFVEDGTVSDAIRDLVVP